MLLALTHTAMQEEVGGSSAVSICSPSTSEHGEPSSSVSFNIATPRHPLRSSRISTTVDKYRKKRSTRSKCSHEFVFFFFPVDYFSRCSGEVCQLCVDTITPSTNPSLIAMLAARMTVSVFSGEMDVVNSLQIFGTLRATISAFKRKATV